MRREIKDALRQNLAIGSDDDQIGGKLLEKTDFTAKSFRLVYGEAAKLGLDLDRRWLESELTAPWPVRLSDRGDDFNPSCVNE